jgi:uncharacterized protein (TIGR00297 family)
VNEFLVRAAIGAGVSTAAATLAWRLRGLTRSGAWAAAVCGTLLYVGGGWRWLVLVGVFFVTSSVLTRLDPPLPASRRSSLDRRGRRWDQVAANGGVAALAAVAFALTSSPAAFTAAAGATAAATADTWASELGRWSPIAPRLITTGAVVPPGSSGAVSLVGTLGAAAGALLIAGAAAVLTMSVPEVRQVAAIAAAGFVGMLVDSVLGATAERRWSWVGNSLINFVTTGSGAIVAITTASWWR